jgi:hypothetical protein
MIILLFVNMITLYQDIGEKGLGKFTARWERLFN